MLPDDVLFPKGKRVGLIFCGVGSNRAPFFDPSWTFWSIPSNHLLFAKVTDGGWAPHLWFDIHRDEIWQEEKGWHEDYQGWLKALKQPIVMADVHPEVPTSLAYPFDELNARFGDDAPIAGTLDWMIALALAAGAATIGLFGADYRTAHEEVYQWFGAAYWCGVAKGLGVPIFLPPGNKLLQGPIRGRYGPDFPPWPPGHHPYLRRWYQLEDLKERAHYAF